MPKVINANFLYFKPISKITHQFLSLFGSKFNDKEQLENKFQFEQLMQTKRLQELWTHRSNNSQLLITPTQSQIQNIYSFCQNFNEHLTHFVYTCMHMPKTVKTQDSPLLIDTEDGIAMLVEILKEQKFVFIDGFSEQRQSYKGYVAWLVVGTLGKLYVVDAGRLHDNCYILKEALQRKQLIKFMNGCQQVMNAFKRDWQIFVPNVFDLDIIQRHLSKQGKYSHNPRLNLKQHLISPPYPLAFRPMKPLTLSQFQDYFQSQLYLLAQLDKFFTTSDPSYHSYAYFNHYQFLLKSYYHHSPSVKERDQSERAKRQGDAFEKYEKYQRHGETSSDGIEDWWWVKNAQEEQMATMLCEWREHVAKMRDINPQEILAYQTISRLAKTRITSILQISQLCAPNSQLCTPNTKSCPPLYPLSLNEFQQIFQLFQLHKQQLQQSGHQLSIPRRLPYFKATDQKPIRQLLSQIKFTDVSNDWLNKNTDESVRLYKQIVSINEFDNSVVDEYLKEMTGMGGLSVQEINRYVKYAEFLRVGNHKRLQEVHEKAKNHLQNTSCKNYLQNTSCKDHQQTTTGKNHLQPHTGNAKFVQQQYFEDNFIDNFIDSEQYKNWDQIQQQINFPTMDTINQPRSNQSLTSIKSMSSLNIQSCKHFTTSLSSSVLKQKQLNSLRLLQSPSIFTKIQPLPENIELIYLEAARAKKSYVTKGHKKSNKVGKKEPNTNRENGVTKQQEFVPKKDEIFNLVYY